MHAKVCSSMIYMLNKGYALYCFLFNFFRKYMNYDPVYVVRGTSPPPPPLRFQKCVSVYIDFTCILLYVRLSAGKWCTLLLHWPLEKKLTLFMLSRPLVRGRSFLTNRCSWKRWDSFWGVHIVTLTTKRSQKNFIAPNPVQVVYNETKCPFRGHTHTRPTGAVVCVWC